MFLVGYVLVTLLYSCWEAWGTKPLFVMVQCRIIIIIYFLFFLNLFIVVLFVFFCGIIYYLLFLYIYLFIFIL